MLLLLYYYYLLLYLAKFICYYLSRYLQLQKNDEIRRPRRSFMLAYYFIMNTPTIYTLSFYYVYDEHVQCYDTCYD